MLARLRTGVLLLTLGLARAEHGDTIVHTHDGPYNSLHRRDTAVRVRQIFPLGGPFVGNTAITVSGNNFRDVGDVKCRFGVDEVQARLVTVAEPRLKTNPRGSYFPDIPIEVNVTTLECSSPGCRSPSCLPDAAAVEHAVPVEVSMNGVTFTGTGLQFNYYDQTTIHVSVLTPRGGPRYGGTKVLVHGVGFRDLTSGVNGVVKQGIKCKFGQNDMVNATKGLSHEGDPFSARCHSPVDTLFVGTPGLQGRLNQSLRDLPLELTFNGYDTEGTITASGVPYTYYEESAFNVSRIHPLGGPDGGGTQVSVYLVDDALLTDLGGSGRGLYCRFSYYEPVEELAHEYMALRRVTVNASLSDCAGARACGGGGGHVAVSGGGGGGRSLTCKAPPYTGPHCEGKRTVIGPGHTAICEDARNVTVEVSLNGQQFTSSGVHFEYYDQTVWKTQALWPRGGPLGGNTSLLLSGMRLKPLGDVRCRLGVLNPEVDGHVVYGIINAAVASGEQRQSCGCEKLRDQFCDYSGPVAAEIAPVTTVPAIVPTSLSSTPGCLYHAYGICQVSAPTWRDFGAGGPYAPAESPYAPRHPGVCRSCADFPTRHSCAASGGTSSGAGGGDGRTPDHFGGGGRTPSHTDGRSSGVTSSGLHSRGAENCKKWCHPRQRFLSERTHRMARITCAAPPHWRVAPGAKSGAIVETQEVEVEVTLNGQDYLEPQTPHISSYAYYPVDAAPYGLSMLGLSPRGGPTLGGTRVLVNGTGLRDYGGLWCEFGDGTAVQASRQRGLETVVCISPPLQPAALAALGNVTSPSGPGWRSQASINLTLELSTNGQHHARTAAGLTFEYYVPESLAVSAVYPRGGPPAGGAAVTVWGAGFRDLDHGAGLSCKFGTAPLVPATLATDADDGGQSLTCKPPPHPDCVGACESVDVRVTLNGDNPDDIAGTSRSQPCCELGEVLYAFYETYEDNLMEVGRSTPSIPAGQDTTLTEDPPDWTGDDMP